MVVAGLPGYGDEPRLRRVLELTMASMLPDEAATVIGELAQDLADGQLAERTLCPTTFP